jgi:hypothetical protein
VLKPSLRYYYYGVCKNLLENGHYVNEISHPLEKESIRYVKYATQIGNYGFLQCCFFHGFFFKFLIYSFFKFCFLRKSFFKNHQGRSDTRVGIIMVWSPPCLTPEAWLNALLAGSLSLLESVGFFFFFFSKNKL